MGDFQLILFSEANRPVRKAQKSGAFSLIQFSERTRTGMGSALSEKSEIKPEDIEAWYSPMEACAYAATCVGVKGASDALWQLLEGGMIEAVAGSSSMTPHERGPITDNKPILIPKRMWKSMSATGTDLWGAAYARFWTGGTAYRFFGIKLNPDDVHKNLPESHPLESGWIKKKPEPEAPAAAPAKVEEPEPEIKKSAVPAAYLAAWFEFYKKISGEMREDPAWDHARRCFPNNSITRQKICDLLPERPMGRPKTRET